MSLVTELHNIAKEAFANKDSRRLAEYLTDDHVMITPTVNRTKQEILDWIDAGDGPPMSNLKVIYENDEIAVIYHDMDTVDPDGNAVSFTVMCCGRKRGNKCSDWRIARAGDKT